MSQLFLSCLTSHFGSSLQGLSKEVKNINEEVCRSLEVLGGKERLWYEGEGDVLVEEVLDGLEGRLKLMNSVLEERCDNMKEKLQELNAFQVSLLRYVASVSYLNPYRYTFICFSLFLCVFVRPI